jgi:acyl-CoA synthetase (AMP-forming)/AMP-acid ligase II
VGEYSIFLTRMLDVLCDGGDRIAFAQRDRSITYRETFEKLRRLHGTLKTEGIAPGQLVAITGGNMPERMLLQIAAQLRGARVAHVESVELLDTVHPDHVISSDPEGPLMLASTGPAPTEADIALPRSVETLFPADGRFVSHGETYEEIARTCRPQPEDPQRVLLIAPMSHPIGNRIACKALLCGNTVVLHERLLHERVLHERSPEEALTGFHEANYGV